MIRRSDTPEGLKPSRAGRSKRELERRQKKGKQKPPREKDYE